MNNFKIFILLICVSLTTACSFQPLKPWVAPYEREYLADPIMEVDRDPVFSQFQQHVYETREGARGATSAKGSGCGCN
ncbi:MAG: DUF4266 domain-containing protein [Pseudomonadota bacterium]